MSFAKKKIDSSTLGALKAHVKSRINAGYKKKAIYDDLCLNYVEKEKLAAIIAQIPYPGDRRSYGTLNFIVALLFAVIGSVKLDSLLDGHGTSRLFSLWQILVCTGLLWAAKEIFLFRGYAYRAAGILGILCLFDFYQSPWLLLVEGASIAGSFFLAAKLFPFMGLLSAKKKPDGSFKFGSESVREY